jgi:hypothetical protein
MLMVDAWVPVKEVAAKGILLDWGSFLNFGATLRLG